MCRLICAFFVFCTALPLLAQEVSVSILDLNTTGIPPNPYVFFELNQPTLDGRLYFRALSDDGDELWVTDGTAPGTVVQDLSPGLPNSQAQIFTVVGDRIFFRATTLDAGTELWSTQGPDLATMVIDLEAGPEGSSPRALTAFGDDLFFTGLVSGLRGMYAVDSQSLALTPLAVDVVEPDIFTEIVDDGSRVYFKGTALAGGSMEIWATDGTAVGTEQATDISCADWGELLGVATSVFAVCDDGATTQLLRLDPAPADGVVLVHDFGDTSVEQLTPAGGTLYMVVDDSEIWSYDNGTGTITQITSFGQTTQPDNLTRYQGNLLFAADADLGKELYWTDGVTVTAFDIQPGATGSGPSMFRPHNEVVYFVADDGDHGREIWVTDGTPSGTIIAIDTVPGPGGGNPELGSSTPFGLVFQRWNEGVWVTDGTLAGTAMLPFPMSFATSPTDLHADEAGGRVFFVGEIGVGAEPMVTDGSLAGSIFVADINPGFSGSSAEFLATLPNGKTLFTAVDGTNTRHLWSTMGQPGDATFTRVIDPYGLPTSLDATVFGGHAYFCASNGVDGVELWRSDGTGVGTELFVDLHPTDDGDPCDRVVFEDELYFGAYDAGGAGLWRTDGTAAGTELVARTNANQELQPRELTVMGVHLYFTANAESLGRELWRSDGTEAGTEVVLDINPGSGGSSPWSLLAAGGFLYFEANDGLTGSELWRSDGTAAGTILVADLDPISGSSPLPLAGVGGGLVFVADDGGDRLYFTDGSAGSATQLLAPLYLNRGDKYRAVLFDHLYFVARVGTWGTEELWRTDGTVAGTVDLDLEPGIAGSNPKVLVVVGNRLFFSAYDATTKREIHILEETRFVDDFETGDTSQWSVTSP